MHTIFEHPLKLPNRIWEGRGSVQILDSRLSSLNIQRPFVVVDPVVYQTDFGKRALDSIQDDHRALGLWTEVETNTPRDQVERAAIELASHKPDGVVVIGGGSSIDLAKTALALAISNQSLEALWAGEPISGLFPPLFAVPTTCGTGSETGPFAVVLDPRSRRKRGLASPYLIPSEAILDADSLDSLPSRLIAATGVDALCHAMEIYVSAKSTPVTRCGSMGAILTLLPNIKKATLERNPASLEYLLVGSATARLLYPRTGLTIAHSMSHPLGAYFGIHHGEAVARAMIPALRFNASVVPFRYAEIARFVGIADRSDSDVKASMALANWLEELLYELDLAQEPLSLPSNSDTVIRLMAQDTLKSSNIPSNPREVGIEDVIRLLGEIVFYNQ